MAGLTEFSLSLEYVDEFCYLREVIWEGGGMKANSIASNKFRELLSLSLW